MTEVHITGQIRVKKATHVPVVRRWRIVWERREFGTRTIPVNETIRVNPTALAHEGVRLRLANDVALEVRHEHADGEYRLRFGLTFQGATIPGTEKTLHLPELNDVRLARWSTTPWRGVSVELEARLRLRKMP